MSGSSVVVPRSSVVSVLRATHSLLAEVGTGVLWVLTGTHPCGTSTQAGWWRYQSASSCVRQCWCWCCCTRGRAWSWWFYRVELSVIRTPPRSISRALSFDLGTALTRSADSSTFSLCERSWALVITTFQSSQCLKSRLKCVHDIYQLGLEFAEVLRFICGQRLLVRQVTLFSTVDYGYVLCTSVSIEHVRRDLELTTVVQHCRNHLNFVGEEFVSMLVEVDISDCHRARHVRAESHTAADEFWWALLLGRLPACLDTVTFVIAALRELGCQLLTPPGRVGSRPCT